MNSQFRCLLLYLFDWCGDIIGFWLTIDLVGCRVE